MTACPRRLRFSLRTLFVLMTVGCVWLGWESHIVSHRQEMRRQIVLAGGRVLFFDIDTISGPAPIQISPRNPTHRVSRLRLWMGDRHDRVIKFDRPLTEDDRVAIKAFPEAAVHWQPLPNSHANP